MAVPHTPQHLKTNKQRADTDYNSTFAIAWDIGVVMIIIAIGGIFDGHFIGLQLSFMHCLVLAATGALSIISGITSRRKSFFINLGLGVFFLLNAVLGFIVGDRGQFKLGYGTSEDLVVKLAPGFLELSTLDHILHMVLAIFFFIEAYSWRRKSLDFPYNLRKRSKEESKDEIPLP